MTDLCVFFYNPNIDVRAAHHYKTYRVHERGAPKGWRSYSDGIAYSPREERLASTRVLTKDIDFFLAITDNPERLLNEIYPWNL